MIATMVLLVDVVCLSCWAQECIGEIPIKVKKRHDMVQKGRMDER